MFAGLFLKKEVKEAIASGNGTKSCSLAFNSVKRLSFNVIDFTTYTSSLLPFNAF